MPKQFQTGFRSRRWLSERTFEVAFHRPSDFSFRAGQCVSIDLEGIQRDYSPVTAPDDPDLAFCVRHVEEGAVSPILAAMEAGAVVTLTGPYGYFTFRETQLKPVFVATGTGIAPFVSMARSGITGFILLHGISAHQELYYREEMTIAAESYIPCLSGEGGGMPGAFRGTVTAYLEKHFPAGAYDFYLSGRSEMIRDVIELVDELFPGSRIFSEAFY